MKSKTVNLFQYKTEGEQLQQPITEQEGFVDHALQKQIAKTCQASLKAISADLKAANDQIEELIQSDTRLKELFEWIISVPGIGTTTATEVLVATNEFTAINEPKKLAASAFRFEPLYDSKMSRVT